MLIKLPNGSWVHPSTVIGIALLEASDCTVTGAHYDERVRIDLSNGMYHLITPDDPMAFVDAFAAEVNAALA